jgi:hypothetical protein
MEKQDALMDNLSVSLELNRLYGTENEALKAGAYKIEYAGKKATHVYLTVGKDDSVKVFKAPIAKFRKSKFSNMKIQVRGNHPYSEGKTAKDLLDGGS